MIEEEEGVAIVVFIGGRVFVENKEEVGGVWGGGLVLWNVIAKNHLQQRVMAGEICWEELERSGVN